MKKAYKEKSLEIKDVISVACCINRIKGYTNVSSYLEDQGMQQWNNKEMLVFHFYPELSAKGYIFSFTPIEEDFEKASEIIRYFKRLTFGVIGNTNNDYLNRVFSVTQSEKLSIEELGVAASIPNLYDREKSFKEIKSQLKTTLEEFIGNEGETVYLNVKYVNTRFLPRLNCFAHEAITDTNHLISFLNKIELGAPGSKQKIRGKVKRHVLNYHTKTPETQINYVKVLETMVTTNE